MDDRTVIVGIVAVATIVGVAMIPAYHLLQSVAPPPESAMVSAPRWEATLAGPELEDLRDTRRFPYHLYNPALGVHYEVEVTPPRTSIFAHQLKWLRVLWHEIEVTPAQQRRRGE